MPLTDENRDCPHFSKFAPLIVVLFLVAVIIAYASNNIPKPAVVATMTSPSVEVSSTVTATQPVVQQPPIQTTVREQRQVPVSSVPSQKLVATKYLYQRGTIASQLMDIELAILDDNPYSATSSETMQNQKQLAMNLYSDISLKLDIPALPFSDALVRDKNLLAKEALDIAYQAMYRADNSDAYTDYESNITKFGSDTAFALLTSRLSAVPNYQDENNLIAQDEQQVSDNYGYIDLGVKRL